MMAEESAEMENKLKTVSATRQGKFSVSTRKINELRSLLADDGDTERVLSGAEQFKMTLNIFKNTHAPDEIKENDARDWDEPKMETFKKFLLGH